tara:strand:+ start:350 stop:619 length:270 start_codon:yes stop_codon:yes gene_type:complete
VCKSGTKREEHSVARLVRELVTTNGISKKLLIPFTTSESLLLAKFADGKKAGQRFSFPSIGLTETIITKARKTYWLYAPFAETKYEQGY